MLVKDWMAYNPVTISKNTTIAEALELMREEKVRRLPVVDKGKLIGIVTDRDLSEVSPSPATTLSVFELNYLLARTKIVEVLPKNQKLITVSPEDYLEKAAFLMRKNGVGSILVVEKDKLVGIITESNIFDAFIDIMGIRQPGMHLHIKVENRNDVLAEAFKIILESGVNISNLVYSAGKESGNLIIRIDDVAEKQVMKVLQEAGFQVLLMTS